MRGRQIISIVVLALMSALSWATQTPEHGLISVVCMTGMLVICSLSDDDGRR